jgi:general secretion pathway protein N
VSARLKATVLVVLFVLGLLISAPASMIAMLLPADTVRMVGVSGSVWRGSAARVMLNTPGGYLHFGAVNWRLFASSLLLFSPRATIHSRWGDQLVTATIRLRGSADFDLKDFDAQVSARLLQQFAPVTLGGRFFLQASELQIRKGYPVSATGRAQWRDATWTSDQGPSSLGDYALDIDQLPGQGLRGEIVTLSGPVNASGTVILENHNYSLNILLGSESNLGPQLRQALSLIAQPVGQKFRVELSGSL